MSRGGAGASVRAQAAALGLLFDAFGVVLQLAVPLKAEKASAPKAPPAASPGEAKENTGARPTPSPFMYNHVIK